MTAREYLLVLAAALIGAIPAYFTFQYLNTHPSVLASLNGSDADAELLSHAQSTASVLLSSSRKAVAETYQARPQKETTGHCTHSYYFSYVLTLATNGRFSLLKSCESARDSALTWFGVASTTWAATFTSGTSSPRETRSLSITGDSHGPYDTPIELRLGRDGEVVSIVQSDLGELATTTLFIRVPQPN